MSRFVSRALGAAAILASQALATSAMADTESVFFNHLVSTAVVANPLGGGDTLFVDTLVTTETGALNQTVTFTVDAGVVGATGSAAWFVTTPAGAGPRLVGVDINIFNAANALVYSDSFQGVLAGVAVSTLNGAIGPGTYTLVATGTGVRDSSLDISLTFAVPEPSTYALMLAGAAVLAFVARRRKQQNEA